MVSAAGKVLLQLESLGCVKHLIFLFLLGPWIRMYSFVINLQAFFITNLEPANFWEFVTLILEGLEYQR